MVVLLYSPGLGVSPGEPLDRSGWVDPHDMGVGVSGNGEGGDRSRPSSPYKLSKDVASAKKETNGKEPGAHQESMMARLREVSGCTEVQRSLEKCLAQKDRSMDDQSTSAIVFLRRHVHLLLRSFGLDDISGLGEKKFVVEMALAAENLEFLRMFASEVDVPLGDVDHALSHMFKSVREVDEEEAASLLPSSSFVTTETLWTLAAAASLMAALSLLWKTLTTWKVPFLLLVVSTGWHWTHLYKKALSKKHATLNDKDIPSQCFPERMKWWQAMAEVAFPSKACHTYYEALVVDPLWEVSPTMALAETVVQFVLLPLQHVGQHLGKFFSGLLGELSWLSSSSVLIFTFLALLLFLIMMCGYRVSSPFLFSLEPRARLCTDCVQHRETILRLKGDVKQLRGKVKQLKRDMGTQHMALQFQARQCENPDTASATDHKRLVDISNADPACKTSSSKVSSDVHDGKTVDGGAGDVRRILNAASTNGSSVEVMEQEVPGRTRSRPMTDESLNGLSESACESDTSSVSDDGSKSPKLVIVLSKGNSVTTKNSSNNTSINCAQQQ